MNRKQRRATKSPGQTRAGSDVAGLFAAAMHCHRDGRFGDAESFYRRVLALHPEHADALHRLGVLAYQVGDATVALEFFDRALAIDGRTAAYHVHRGLALAALGRLEEACSACAVGVELSPDSVEGHANLGVVLLQLGRFEAAADAGRRTIALAPALADGHNILGGALQSLGRTEEAIASQQRAVQLAPDFAEAHNGLGQGLWGLGRLEAAESHFRKAIAADPAFTLAYSNLAGVLKAQGRLDQAADSLRSAAALSPDHPAVLNNLALVLMAQGDGQGAMETILHGLAVGESQALRQSFVHCAKTLQIDDGGDSLRPVLTRALREAWGRPEELARIVLEVVKKGPALAAALAKVNRGAAAQAGSLDSVMITTLAEDALLLTLLSVTPNTDFDVERLLVLARKTLLGAAEAGVALSDQEVAFHAVLAQQAFINEYVFNLAADEAGPALRQAERLSKALEAGEAAPVASVLAAAAYLPLLTLAFAERLGDQPWPPPVEDVLRMQITEPTEEARLRDAVPRLTPILDGSLPVQAQYEESPYPRWISTAAAATPESLSEHLLAAYPQAGLAPIADGGIDVLIAGCGTGRNALETHRAFTGARTLAIDLSTASLAYAWRKTLQSGETGIEYAQADLLAVAALERQFDFIEAAGVLHHLADPFAGWRALLSVLRPGGVMRLGFYSALARRNLPELDGVEPAPDSVRQARQMLASRDDAMARQALRAQDFYSLSGCRDLLLHTREHRFSLPELAAFIGAADLRFIGFVIDDDVLAAYQRRFPHDTAGRDLECWDAFERDHPDTFAQMYQFWVQKA